jgi:hypothetical protein
MKMFTNTSVTIYHRSFNSTTRLYEFVRLVVPYAFWDNSKGITKTTLSDESADKAIIVIPYTQNRLSSMTFIKPKAFDALVSKTGYWTINTSDKIAMGTIPDTIDIEDLEKLYDDVLNVSYVDSRLFGSDDMQNIEVGGK